MNNMLMGSARIGEQVTMLGDETGQEVKEEAKSIDLSQESLN